MALLLLVMLVSSFTVFGEELETLPPTDPHTLPPHPHSPTLVPPTHPPVNAPHHHHHNHHHHSPAPTPVHPPSPSPHHTYPPSPTPTKPPTHPHYPPTPSPTKPPTHPHYPPSPSPTKPPTHPHYPPSPTKPPTHPHYPPAPAPTPAKPPTHHHPHYPVNPPVHPPVPLLPPVHPPVPVHPFPRSFVAVQGVVYVKSCKYAGVDTLLGATPLLGAVVKLQCNNTKYKLVQTAKSDKNGYFYFEAPKSITTYGAHKCNVVLVSAPNALKPSNLHGGVIGAVLRPEKPFLYQKLPFLLYTVGPLAFEPKCH